MTGVDLVGRERDDRRVGAEDLERVDEAVQTDRLGAREAELDDLRGGEDLRELTVEVGVDRVVVGRQQVHEPHRHPLLLGEVAAVHVEQARDVLVGDRVVLA